MRIFLHFLVFLASALRDKGVFTFSYVKFYSQTTSRASKIMPCKMKKIPLSNLKWLSQGLKTKSPVADIIYLFFSEKNYEGHHRSGF